ncbi:39S ribosomal protein L46, mitochondrial [Engraulis encrasicolus]|uniref:39S ribosomal protein L46, mitochondrial n=1 Tax=Engraulis encrasicolus TaxID=184585 RepID=UPI002FD75CEC
MAAPCVSQAVRSMWHLRHINRKPGVFVQGIRLLSTSRQCNGVAKPKKEEPKPASQWKLYGAVCLQRLPLVSKDPHPIEKKFADLLHQMEMERSFLSDHEVRLLEDAERLSRKQDGEFDSDDEDMGNQEITTAQDEEDAWEQRLKRFHPAARALGEADLERASLGRCLSESLVLLVQVEVGQERVWMLPQTAWTAGETLRQTAEKALANLPGSDLQARFLGNAPCGVYKYKFPRSLRTETCVGAKVFFFKALLSGGTRATSGSDTAFAWVRRSELKDYLKPEYLKQAELFIVDL